MEQKKIQGKPNFQRELDAIIEQNIHSGKVPTLLLHSCCGPCSSYVVTYLKEYFQVTVLYYNPCIYPEEEYRHRLAEQQRLLKELDIPLLEVGYDHQEFLSYVQGLEAEPEGGARCGKCFAQRLQKTAEIAAEKGFDYFCSTLTVSPHKNAVLINQVGRETAAKLLLSEPSEEEGSADRKTGLEARDGKPVWLPADFKKRDGYKKSIELSHQYGLYRQDYCGCEFSFR